MFSLLRVIWTIWEVSQMIRRLLTSSDKFLDRSWKRHFLNEIVCFENLSVSCYCQTAIVQENWYFLLSINTSFAWRVGVANLITVEILFFLLSRYENLGELCMHFVLQVGSPWTNLTEIWPNCCQIAYLQNCVCEFYSSFHFKVIANFPVVMAIISHPRIYLLVKI